MGLKRGSLILAVLIALILPAMISSAISCSKTDFTSHGYTVCGNSVICLNILTTPSNYPSGWLTYCAGYCCNTGETYCTTPSACKNLQTDNSNCGTCGNACTGGKTCQSGACACPAGQTPCNGICKNLQTDHDNCGSCGDYCDQGAYCSTGHCCEEGYTYDTASSSCKPNCGTISGTTCSVPEDFNPNQILGTTYYCSGTSDVCACSTAGYIATNNHCCPSGQSYDTASSSCKPNCKDAGTITNGKPNGDPAAIYSTGCRPPTPSYSTAQTGYCATGTACYQCNGGYDWNAQSGVCSTTLTQCFTAACPPYNKDCINTEYQQACCSGSIITPPWNYNFWQSYTEYDDSAK